MLFSKALFIQRYTDLHDRIIPNMIDVLAEEKLRATRGNMNTIIWLYWHIFRTEDVGISRFIMDTNQEYDFWDKKVNAETSLNGTGMSIHEVETMSMQLNFAQLINYRKAIKNKTLQLIDNIESIDLKVSPSQKFIEQVICTEQTMPESMWNLLDLYHGKSKEWFLLHVSLTHPFYHLGQIIAISRALSD